VLGENPTAIGVLAGGREYAFLEFEPPLVADLGTRLRPEQAEL